MQNKIHIYFTKVLITLISTLIGNELEIISPAILLLIFLMIIDYISNMLASKKESIEHPDNNEYGWNNKKRIIGIYKKVGYLLTIFVAISTDYLIYNLLDKIGVKYQLKTILGFLITTWFVINELLSILENANRMGVILPEFLKNVLSELKNNVNKYDK